MTVEDYLDLDTEQMSKFTTEDFEKHFGWMKGVTRPIKDDKKAAAKANAGEPKMLDLTGSSKARTMKSRALSGKAERAKHLAQQFGLNLDGIL